ncbi:MAG: hypothetical protein QXQ29_02050 [Candidatus Bathyarchaeia archaeon]
MGGSKVFVISYRGRIKHRFYVPYLLHGCIYREDRCVVHRSSIVYIY